MRFIPHGPKHTRTESTQQREGLRTHGAFAAAIHAPSLVCADACCEGWAPPASWAGHSPPHRQILAGCHFPLKSCQTGPTPAPPRLRPLPSGPRWVPHTRMGPACAHGAAVSTCCGHTGSCPCPAAARALTRPRCTPLTRRGRHPVLPATREMPPKAAGASCAGVCASRAPASAGNAHPALAGSAQGGYPRPGQRGRRLSRPRKGCDRRTDGTPQGRSSPGGWMPGPVLQAARAGGAGRARFLRGSPVLWVPCPRVGEARWALQTLRTFRRSVCFAPPPWLQLGERGPQGTATLPAT